jgi:hypothetical protein
MLHKLVEFIQVDVGEELARVAAYGKASFVVGVKERFVRRNEVQHGQLRLDDRVHGGIVKNDNLEEPEDVRVVLFSSHNIKKDLLVDGDKKGLDVKMYEEGPTGADVAHLPHEPLEPHIL